MMKCRMSVECESVLQRRESLLHSLNRLCGRLSRSAQANMHAVLRVRCRTRRLTPSRLRGTSKHRSRTSIGSSAVLKLFKSRRPYSAFIATESVTCLGQYTFDGPPGSVGRSSRPNESHVILQANPRDLPRRG